MSAFIYLKVCKRAGKDPWDKRGSNIAKKEREGTYFMLTPDNLISILRKTLGSREQLSDSSILTARIKRF